MPERAILHIDMNNFFASVECMLNPELKPFPVAVCGSQEERHGIVLAKNCVAKAKGVSTGEAIWQAKQKCPELVVVPPHYEQYMRFSRLAREIYGRYTDLIEPYGMDEVWADVTGSQRFIGTPLQIAEEIRESIKYELGLTVSIGVSFNKIFAKLGSDMKKPDAITVIPKETFREQIRDLPASEMLGVGRATEKKLSSLGIRTIGQIAQFPVDFFKRRLGKCGVDLWRFANGLDESPVTLRDIEAPDKSVGHGMTAVQDLETPAEVWKFILELCQDIGHRLYVFNKKATGIALAVRDNQLFTKQWQCGLPVPTQSPSCIAKEAFSLFTRSYDWQQPIRSLTVRAIDLISLDTPYQLDLFSDPVKVAKAESLDKVIEELRYRFGKKIIRNACLLDNKKMSPHDNPNIIMPTGIPM
ncbi:MAG: DNA polymerase thumb domain-containing protein [Eubacteriales bacterium]